MLIRPFFDTAKEIRRGQFLEDCADELHKVVASVAETGKAAKLCIEITVKPATRGQGALILSDKVMAKLPALPVGETIMFVTPDNALVANDPRQKDLVFKSVDMTTGELNTASN